MNGHADQDCRRQRVRRPPAKQGHDGGQNDAGLARIQMPALTDVRTRPLDLLRRQNEHQNTTAPAAIVTSVMIVMSASFACA